MTVLFLTAFLFPDKVAAQEIEIPEDLAEDQCVVCHVDIEELPDGFIMGNAHMRHGLSCSGCHGGDPTSDDEEIAMAESAGFIGAPDKKDIPEFCGKCHSDLSFMRNFQPSASTDQVAQYYTSVHGMRLREDDEKVADCTSCHTSHAILPANDPRSTVYPHTVPATCAKCHSDADYMSGYGIRTDQYQQYAESVHGVALLERDDLGAPACNDCHGNHGATPPGATSVIEICGNCHVHNAEYFSASAMGRAFDREQLHACEECHGRHAIQAPSYEFVGVGEESVCMDCHEEGDRGYEVADLLYRNIDSLVTATELGNAELLEVRRIGMDDIDIDFLQQEAHQRLIHARTLVHTFDPDTVRAMALEGRAFAQEAMAIADAEIAGYRVRRMWFFTATLFSTLLAVALFLKIRDFEKNQTEANTA
jgi:hypothetical protein